jgi:hypothetical protein
MAGCRSADGADGQGGAGSAVECQRRDLHLPVLGEGVDGVAATPMMVPARPPGRSGGIFPAVPAT